MDSAGYMVTHYTTPLPKKKNDTCTNGIIIGRRPDLGRYVEAVGYNKQDERTGQLAYMIHYNGTCNNTILKHCGEYVQKRSNLTRHCRVRGERS